MQQELGELETVNFSRREKMELKPREVNQGEN